MAVILLSNLAPIGEPEAEFFSEIIDRFEDLGHQVVFWSTVSHPRLDRVRLPGSWKIKDWLDLYPVDRLSPPDDGDIDATLWAERLSVLTKQDVDEADRSVLLEILMRVSRHIVDTVRPDLFIAWNTLCPHVGVTADLCRNAGIPVVMLERGPLTGSHMLDTGLLGHSWLAGVGLDKLIEGSWQKELCARRGKKVMAAQNLASFNRYQQIHDPDLELSLNALGAGTRIVVFPPDDSSLGFFPVDGDDRKASLPGFSGSFDAARAIAEANEGGVTVFKPHPSFGQLTFDPSETPGLHVIDRDFRQLIAWADVVVTTGSGLLSVAMSMGKPVILMARDMFSGKGIAYEALERGAIRDVLPMALHRQGYAAKQKAFNTFVGWMVKHYLVYPEGRREPFSPRTTTEMVDDLHHAYGRGVPSWTESAELIAACREGRPAQAHGEPDCRVDFSGFAQTVCDSETTLAVVDFDHTLIDGNSTELYLDSIRPRWLAGTIHALLWALAPWRWLGDTPDQIRYRDYIRVVVMTILFPWSPLRWQRLAPKIVARYGVTPLIEALRAPGAAPSHVMSLGFLFILRPLLKAMGLSAARVTGERFVGGPVVRLTGKDRLLQKAHDAADLARAITITDSRHDACLFPLVSQAWLILWPGRKMLALSDVYVPLRYTAEGKYPGTSILRNQHFGEDLVVALLAFALTPSVFTFTHVEPGGLLAAIGAVVLLMVSFFSVYEIGYFENDFVAARREGSPTLSGRYRAFARMPVAVGGWVWGVILGALGCGLASLVPGAPAWSWGMGAWLGLLIITRGLFFLFNRLGETSRVMVFPFLQVVKSGGMAVVFGLTSAGAVIVLSQVFRQTSNYMVYRHGGDTRRLRRQSHRLVVAVVLGLALSTVDPAALSWQAPQIWLIALWIIHRVLRERFGRSLQQQGAGLIRVVRELGHGRLWSVLAQNQSGAAGASGDPELAQARAVIEQQNTLLRRLKGAFEQSQAEQQVLQKTVAQQDRALKRAEAERDLLAMTLDQERAKQAPSEPGQPWGGVGEG